MQQTNVLDALPLPVVLVLTIAFVSVAAEMGYRLGRIKLKQLPEGESLHLGAAVASTIGLLAFMLAFTFGSGTSRLDERRQLVLDSSNAVSTAFLRANLLSEPYRGQSKALLEDYIELLLSVAPLAEEDDATFYETLSRNIQKLKDIQQKLWAVAVTAAREDPRPTNNLYISGLNNVFELLQKRLTVSMQQRMPVVFWLVLFCLAGLALGLAGYDAGSSRSKRNLSIPAMSLAFSFVMVFVLAMDRPRAFTVSQTPLIELQAHIRASESIN